MRLRSLDQLQLERSWQRVLFRVRADVMDIPDRFPFEVAARYWNDGPRLDANHQVQLIHRVPGTKPAQATARPFVRVHPQDLLLYQALVDALRDKIEEALGSDQEVIGYRLAPLDTDDPLANSPRWRDFDVARYQLASDEFDGYVIEGDVASYFLSINIGELERRLLETGCDGDVVRDLGGLLSGWNAQGVRGLPQGVFPSSPLANFYLVPLDRLLRSKGAPFARYMDDLAVVAPTYQGARELLDQIEELLYEDRLSLGGGKSSISRSENVLQRLTPEEDIEEFIAALEDAGDYAPGEEEIEEMRLDRICEVFDAAVDALDSDEYRRSHFTFAYRQLARKKHPHALSATPRVLLRMPGLTSVAARYLEAIAIEEHREAVSDVLARITFERFHRPQEWLHLLRAIQVLPDRAAHQLVPQLADLASASAHPLVRARALLAWARQSDPAVLDAADQFFAHAERPWLPYCFVAIQDKDQGARNDRYSRWSSEGRGLAWLADSIRAERFAWRRI